MFRLVFFVLLCLKIDLLNSSLHGSHVKFFDNIAEISQPISPYELPKYFTPDEWSDLRSDSIRLIGRFIRINSQSLSLTRASLNGQKILIQRQPNDLLLTEAIMIDESRNLIHDLTDSTYYTINSERIRYLTIPTTQNYSVDFQFEISHPEQLQLRYLRNNIRWKVRYDLSLTENDVDSFLQAYADIRNDGNSLMKIESAELISGNIDIRSNPSNMDSMNFFRPVSVEYAFGQQTSPAPLGGAPTVEQAQEISGIYVFPINQSFVLEPLSNFIVPMFRPRIHVERYAIIEKYFSRTNNRGNARRAYRLTVPDFYLPRGQVFIRESDRLVGETNWIERSANETNDFNLGVDPDLLFNENILLNSRRQAHEENGYRIVLSTYTIQLTVINKKTRSMNFQYKLRFPSQEYLVLKENTSDNLLTIDGPTIIGLLETNPNGQRQIQFTVETQ